MTGDRWQQVSKIYHAARQFDERDRGAFVRDACAGDEVLQREVESLLGYGSVAESPIERPAAAVVAQILDPAIVERAGQQIGPYTIESLLDSGGMGDVYRARDTKLGREVAIKILPVMFSADFDWRARFEREARLLAALNHPHIAQIYGLEESGGVQALVMELVPGNTLGQMIQANAKPGRGLPLALALDLARQIADALQAAHEKGIIHRDLKPANIKVTPDGSIKVLDFGLAKPIVGDAGSVEPLELPTVTIGRTREGVIVGTPAYMSPEQATGRTADRRSDIWAFGCVLFEMLTARRAFDAEDIAATISAVISKEPEWTALPRETPAPVRRVLRRCLQKDRKRRLADASDVRLEIEDALAPAAGEAAPLPPQAGSRLAGWMVAGAAVLAAGALALPAISHLREVPPVPPAETRLDITTPATTDPLSFALSPDGKQIVYAASAASGTRLWLRSLSLDSTTARPLPGTEGATFPFWSPDSRSIGFFAGGELKSLHLDAGQPHGLALAPVALGGTWNADRVILFVPTANFPVFRVDASGEQVPVTTLNGPSGHRFPHFLPGGHQFLYYASGSTTPRGIYVGSLSAPVGRWLTPSDTPGAYLARTERPREATGWLVWIQAGALRAQHLDLQREQLTGDLLTLADPVAYDPSTAGGFSALPTGMLAYRSGEGGERRQLTWVNRSGKTIGIMGGPDTNGMTNPRISPDGHRVAIARTVQGNKDIWLVDPMGMTQFTFDPGSDNFPIWSPDGSRLAFHSSRTGSPGVYIKPVSMARPEERLSDSVQVPTDWSQTAPFLLYFVADFNGGSPNGASDIWVLPLTGDRRPWAFLKTQAAERWATFSPNGRWVAYMSNQSGRDEIYVRPMWDGSGVQSTLQRQASKGGGVFPTWRNDGKEIYYLAPDGQMMAVPMTERGTEPGPGTPVALFHTDIVGGGQDRALGRQYDVSRDGRFLINTVVDKMNTTPITVIQNWRPLATGGR